MQTEEFEKIWTLYRTLFPASAAKLKSENIRMVWRVALAPFAMDDVVEASMNWARRNKFFPDIADITGGLAMETKSAAGEDAAAPEGMRLTADMLPYIRKFYGELAETRRRQMHAAGLETWFEAEARGVSWLDWIGRCRAVYGEDILPAAPDPAEVPDHA